MAKHPWNQANLFGDPQPDQPKKVVIKIPPGTPAAICTGANCKARIFWVETAAGRSLPVDADGTPHWATCPDKDRFKKK